MVIKILIASYISISTHICAYMYVYLYVCIYISITLNRGIEKYEIKYVCKKWARGRKPKRALQIARMTQIESDRRMSVTYSYRYKGT